MGIPSLKIIPWLSIIVWAGIASAQSWTEQAIILTASNKAAGDRFGSSVSLTDNYALVGSPDADPGGLYNAGAAYVFARSGTTWTEQAILTGSNKAAGDKFGSSVSLTDNYAITGSPGKDHGWVADAGAAYIFFRSGTTWIQEAILTASNKAWWDRFGSSVSLAGDSALIGALGSNRTYRFIRHGTTWTESSVSNTCCPQSTTETTNYKIQGEPTLTIEGLENAGQAIVFINSEPCF
eukprot:TRINITY_DN498_c0_g1_i8.p1 TRINITY_DN498_c0_g1~~TRINITY_DN498_c0_g1_i8.p1  ORF type:complete len:237 (-),score=19.46 TRINITY_DN498_c0_g1_i8:680-1390(-)